MDLMLKLPIHQEGLSLPLNRMHSNDTEGPEVEFSDRTHGINEFSVTTKEVVSGKHNNIKSYLRIKPNKNVPFMPFHIHHNQTIVYDRSLYKFDYIFPP